MQREVYQDAEAVAERAARDAIDTLSEAIDAHGKASWALAGGSSPMAAYKQIIDDYADALDWSKVMILIGDERCVPHAHPDSNWGSISKVLFTEYSIAQARQLAPPAEHGPGAGARQYEDLIRSALADANNELSFDLLWLGVGEDGHTLSLFPGQDTLEVTDCIVLPVYDSPKPPPERITLSVYAAACARKAVIFAVGESKRQALIQVTEDPGSLPIGCVAAEIARAGGEVLWLYDEAADPELV